MLFHQINTRNIEETLNVINTHDGNVVGFEVVEKEVVEVLHYNIDPQHTGFKWMGMSDGKTENISASRKILGFLHHKLTGENDLLIGASKPDIDSVCAMALYAFSGEISAMENHPENHHVFHALCERVKSIDVMDCGLGNIPGKEWNPEYHRKQLIKEVSVFNILGAMCSDFRLSLAEKVEVMKTWLISGDLSHLQKYAEQVSIEFLAQKDTLISKMFGVIVVESNARNATGIIYAHAPFGVAFNSAFPTKEGSIAKFTICEFTANRYLNLQGILDEISEDGWGGNLQAGIVGSPFSGTELGVQQVAKIVSRHVK